MTRKRIFVYLGCIAALLAGMLAWYAFAFMRGQQNTSSSFDGARAYADVKTQVVFGPRIPGSPGHARTVDWIKQQLESAGWSVDIQQAEVMGHPLRNIRAYRGEAAPQLIIGAHYDTRLYASRDPDPTKQQQPVPGADDGASGVAVLLELARTLPSSAAPTWLVFFDAEDNGNIPGWDWSLGSQAFVAGLKERPKAMVLLDMVGDENLSIPMESLSDPGLRDSIWNTAAELGYASYFPARTRYSIEDDHVPFLDAGIPAVDIIDIDYPYWHTTSDLPEHVSAKSLQIVGNVMLAWIKSQPTK